MQYHIFSQQYEIKRIVAHRGFHRRSEYWVPWVGYDAAWDMWLHRDVLECERLPPSVLASHCSWNPPNLQHHQQDISEEEAEFIPHETS